MDAIDVALADIDAQEMQVIHYGQHLFQDQLRAKIRSVNKNTPIADVANLDVSLGQVFANVVISVIKHLGLKAEDINAVGCHGQTILHLPELAWKTSVQIGDPNIIAYRTGITTVSDFRRMDMAAGGQGAPLTPAFHAHQFRSRVADRIILNIGGIANITVLPATDSPASGFDVGPGNCLLDDWNYRHNKTSMDRGGEWASSGTVNTALLNDLLNDGYLPFPLQGVLVEIISIWHG